MTKGIELEKIRFIGEPICCCSKLLFEINKTEQGTYEILTKMYNGKSAYPYILQMGKRENGKQRFDLETVKSIFDKFENIDHNNIYHINLFPETILDDYFYKQLLQLLLQNQDDLSCIKFEILEINKEFSLEEIALISERMMNIKDAFGIEFGIDDFPEKSNDINMIEYIKGISFVKIDKGILLDYLRGKIDKKTLVVLLKEFVKYIKHYQPDVEICVEGIETREVYELICTNIPEIKFFQGYYFQDRYKI